MTNENISGLDRLRFLIGQWQGYGEGFGQKSEVTHTYQPILQYQFIQCQTRSVTREADGAIKEVHEDLEIYSYDMERKQVVLRGFYSEGYVNEYVMDEGEGENLLILTTERTQNAGGMRARLRMEIASGNEYTLTLDLARQGEEFKPCQVSKMRKVS